MFLTVCSGITLTGLPEHFTSGLSDISESSIDSMLLRMVHLSTCPDTPLSRSKGKRGIVRGILCGRMWPAECSKIKWLHSALHQEKTAQSIPWYLVSNNTKGKLSTCEHRSGCPSPSRSELGQTHFPLCGAHYTSSTMSLLPSQHCRYPFVHLGGEE